MRTGSSALAIALLLPGCGRFGFDPLGGGGGGDDVQNGSDAGVGIITTPFLDCDGIDDGVHVQLSGFQRARTYELRARVVDPEAAGIGEHELLTVRRSTAPGRLDGLRIIAEVGAPEAAPAIPPAVSTRLEMFETLDGNIVTGVSGPLEVEARWTHYAMVYVPASEKFQTFRDGLPSGNSLTLTLTMIDAFDLCGEASGRRIAAEIDWVRISDIERYDTAFTPTVARPPVDPGALALLDFDAGTVTDLVGNSAVTTSGGVLIGQP